VVDVSAEFVVVATVSETGPAVAVVGEEAVIEVYVGVPVLVPAVLPNFTEL
jgi:hypothetical protein